MGPSVAPDDPETEMPADLDEAGRRNIFAAAAGARDCGLEGQEVREYVASVFGVTAEQVREIEREGVRNSWPPLGDESDPESRG
jgi:hypothetical protein